MRTPLVAGNWKMNKTTEQARALVQEMMPEILAIQNVETVLCPPFTSLMAISAALAGSKIGLGAQDMHWEASGAFTGEIAPNMVKEYCNYVILGHSERRTYFGETDTTVNKKTKTALQHGLVPIVCIGETLAENESGKTAEVVTRQIREGLDGLEGLNIKSIVVAYEPVWAIGTGKASSAEGANQVIRDYIRSTLKARFGEEAAVAIRILYGGSVTGVNAREYFQQPEIDGALVGGASLKNPDFAQIVKAAVK
jgi:triosephosphate isomerase (TIM)